MSSKEFTAKTFKWLYQVNWDPNLMPVDLKVAVQLTCHFNEDDKDGRAFSGCKYMANKVGLSERTVNRSVRRLHRHGHLRVVQGARGRGRSNQYWMVLDEGEKTGTAKPVSTSQKTRTAKPVLEKENRHLGQRKPASGAHKTGTAVTANHTDNHWGNHTRARRPHFSGSKPSTSSSSSERSVIEEGVGFEQFWSVYPKQVDRLATEKAFDKALKLATADQIIEGAGRYARDPERIGRGERYTKHPANWLRDGSWANSDTRVAIDQHGNPVAMPKAPANDDIDAMVASILASGFTLNSLKD